MTLLDWRRVYGQIFPTISAGAFLARLETETIPSVLVTGCQRSGTTWFTRLLGSCLQNAYAPRELEVCNYLINNIDFLSSNCSTLVLQTTFLNTDVESYANLPDAIPVLVIGRNPFSVCWSMVNNWQNLPLEYAWRRRMSFDPDRVHPEHELWSMAIELYRESVAANLAILHGRPSRTRLLIYDELIQNLPETLDNLSDFLDREVARTPPAHDVDLTPAARHQSMPRLYRQLVASECERDFARLKRYRATSNLK